MTKLGKGEGQVNLIAWAGYVEDGSTDPKVDWVSDFEKETGCQVNVKIGNTSDEMVTLMRTGQYDGVSASGDATLRLIAGGDVAPVNTDLIPNYADVFEALKDQPWNTVDGQAYGIPHGRGANLLMWRDDKVKPAPDSWGAVFDENSPYKGKVTAYDNPIYIADAALYLKATQPDLGIDNSYELDDKQFHGRRRPAQEAARDHRRVLVGLHQGAGRVHERRLRDRHDLAGDREPARGRQGADQDDRSRRRARPGWSDTWMISSKAKNPNCMYMWMDHIISPKANAAVAEWFGEAPVEQEVVRGDRGQGPLRHLPRGGRGLLLEGRLLDDADEGLRRRPRSRSARTTPSGSRPGPRSRGRWPPPPPLRHRGTRPGAAWPASSGAAPGCSSGCCWPGRSAGW